MTSDEISPTTTRPDIESAWLLPDPGWPVAAEFWAFAQRDVLAFPRCAGCSRFVWYPLPRCPVCRHERFVWTPVAPVGRVHSYTTIRRAFLPHLDGRVPHTVVQVRFPAAPGVTFVTAASPAPVDVPVDEMRQIIGRSVEIVFEASPSGFKLPAAAFVEQT